MQTLLFLVLLLVNSNSAQTQPAASSAGPAVQTGIIQTLDSAEPHP